MIMKSIFYAFIISCGLFFLNSALADSQIHSCLKNKIERNCDENISCQLNNLTKAKQCDQYLIKDTVTQQSSCIESTIKYCISKNNLSNFDDESNKSKKIKITSSLCQKIGELHCKKNEFAFDKKKLIKLIKEYKNSF